MTYVLIVVSWLVGNGAVISTQEFTSAERCEAAKMTLIDYSKARGAEETLRPPACKCEDGLHKTTSGAYYRDVTRRPFADLVDDRRSLHWRLIANVWPEFASRSERPVIQNNSVL